MTNTPKMNASLRVPINHVALIEDPARIRALTACLRRMVAEQRIVCPPEIRAQIVLNCVEMVSILDILAGKRNCYGRVMIGESVVKFAITDIVRKTYSIRIKNIRIIYTLSHYPTSNCQIKISPVNNIMQIVDGYNNYEPRSINTTKAKIGSIFGYPYSVKFKHGGYHRILEFVDE